MRALSWPGGPPRNTLACSDLRLIGEMRVLLHSKNPRGPTSDLSSPWRSLHRNRGASDTSNSQDLSAKAFTDFAFGVGTPEFLCKGVCLGGALHRNPGMKRAEIAPGKLGKGGNDASPLLKPFVVTRWVASPTRQSLASSRKRVLRAAVGRPTPRSVDSERQGPAIEPRNRYRRG